MSGEAAKMNPRRWLILGVGVAAQAASSIFQFGLPFLLPQLLDLSHGSLPLAGLLVACPNIGLMLTLILWGWVADMWGERLTMSLGLTGAAVLIAGTLPTKGPLALGIVLVLAGAAAASVNAASGRVIMAWFGPGERGLAMGMRQTAQPIGVAVAALALPLIAAGHGFRFALLVPATACLAVGVAVLFLVTDPPAIMAGAGPVTGSPYRSTPIWQVHGASALLIVPQFTISTYGYVYLISAQGMGPATAGTILGVTQLLGAAARLGAGHWSDVAGSRLRPMNTLAIANAAIIAALSAAVLARSWVAVPLLIAASIITVSGNGLAFTAVAEIAGRTWSGRALGTQNTIQNAMASLTPAGIGAVITATGFTGGFAAAILFPLLAAGAIPREKQNIDGEISGTRACDDTRQHALPSGVPPASLPLPEAPGP
jgi:sugar phosphate permease